MKRGFLIPLSMIGHFGQGCTLGLPLSDVSAKTPEVPGIFTRIEIETDDRKSGLPCQVVYRPDASTRTVLWRARFEEGFCHRKAEEASSVLKTRGWSCEPVAPEDEFLDRPYVVAVWRCGKASETANTDGEDWPPRPRFRPQDEPDPIDRLTDPTLRSAVKHDLAAMSTVANQSTMSATAEGDLNEDGLRDAVVVLNHQNDRWGKRRLVMAYLGDGETYHLVDVKILPVAEQEAASDLVVDIDDGIIEMKTCCTASSEPVILALHGHRLAYGKSRRS